MQIPVYPLVSGSNLPPPAANTAYKALVLFYSPLPDAQDLLDYLAKIMQAAKLDLDKDCLTWVCHEQKSVNLSGVVSQYTIKNVLMLGFVPKTLGIHLPLVMGIPLVHAGVQYLWAPDLTEIQAERAAGGKTKAALLWQGLKMLFLDAD